MCRNDNVVYDLPVVVSFSHFCEARRSRGDVVSRCGPRRGARVLIQMENGDAN